MTIVLLTGNVAPEAIEKLRAIPAEVRTMSGEIDEERLALELSSAPIEAVLMRSNPPFTRRVLEQAKSLRVIAKHGAGINSIDLEAARDHNILVMTAGDANAHAVAEHAMAMIFALGRELPPLDRAVKSGIWDRESFSGVEIAERTLGVVGFGRIGRRVAQLGKAVGMRVVALSRTPGSVDTSIAEEMQSLEQLLTDSDVVSLHPPLTAQTRHMMNRETLRQMRKNAILINTGRGDLIDEAALADALTSGHLAGAGLDTLASEPPKADNPLLSLPNTLITPHIGGLTAASRRRVALTAADNIVSVLARNSPNHANVVR